MGKLSDSLNIAVSKTYDSGSITASGFTDTDHNLGVVPTQTIVLRELLPGGEWEQLDSGNYVTVTSTQILENGLASLTGGTGQVRILATTEAGLFASLASSTQQGVVSTGAQTFAGDKTFTGVTTLSGGVSGDLVLGPDTGSSTVFRMVADSTSVNQSIEYNDSTAVRFFMNHINNATASNQRLTWGTDANADVFTITQPGKVGIGETAISSSNHLAVRHTDSGSGTSVAPIKIRAQGSNQRVSLQMGNDAANWFAGIDGSTTGGQDFFFIDDNVNNNNKYFTIRQGGNVGIGTDNPSGILHVLDSDLSGTPFLVESNGGSAELLKVDSGGDIFAANMRNSAVGVPILWDTSNGGRLHRNSSSLKYKKDIVDLTYGLSTVEALRAVSYTENDSDYQTIGMIAEEVNVVVPEVVALDGEGNPDGIAYHLIVPILVKAIQELSAKVDALENS